MSNERIDEFLSWRRRLEAPEGVPGQGLDDREAVWERLMDRIAETPRRRRFFGYRLAAACVLLALVPAARFFHERHVRVEAVRPVELRPETAVRVEQPKNGGSGVAQPGAAGAVDAGGQMPAGMAGVARKREGKRPAEVEKLEMARVGQTADKEELSKLEQGVPLPDSGAATATPKQLKNKPLRVVNINELSGNATPAPAITTRESRRHFEIFILPGQSRMALPPPPAPADPALLKVKLSSN